jgi:hypothetical protein
MVIDSSYVVYSGFVSKMDGSKAYFEQNILFEPDLYQRRVYESWASTNYHTAISGGKEYKKQ